MSPKRFLRMQHCLPLAIVLVCLLLALIPVPVATADSVVTFPDANLEAVVRAAIGKPSGGIYRSDLNGLTRLDGSSRGVVDLSGLEYCTNLTVLVLYDNQIADLLPISGLSSLDQLQLAENRIADISPVSGLTNLSNLWLWNNQIADVSPLSGLTRLPCLYLSNNQIADVSPLSGLTRLIDLWLSNNQIADLLPISGLTGLHQLQLDNNQIADLLPISGLTGLQQLNLHNNQIADISPLSGLTGLQQLYLHNNQIADISPLSGLTNLTKLSLWNNQIADLLPISGLTNLTNLWLSNNQIADLLPISGLTGLQQLYLDNNQIADISPLSGLTNLTDLVLLSNQIDDLSPLAGLTGLTNLYLGLNQIDDLSPLVNNPGIASGDWVTLTGNPLNSHSINTCIPQLRARGVTVGWTDSGAPTVDTTPPAAVANLAASTATIASVTLTWTAPGDDGNSGTASAYEVRYSANNITDANWGSATAFAAACSSQSAGSAQSLTVTGLMPNTTYYFAIKTADEVPNWSGLSNVTQKKTNTPPILSPLVGPLEVTSTFEVYSGGKWCFNQSKAKPLHDVGGGINGADDTYAWDAGLNPPPPPSLSTL